MEEDIERKREINTFDSVSTLTLTALFLYLNAAATSPEESPLLFTSVDFRS